MWDPTNKATEVPTLICHYIILATCVVQGPDDGLTRNM